MARTLRTVEQFAEENPAFTAGALRWKIFKAHENGLKDADAIVRCGRRVYIDSDRFFDWLERQQTAA